MPEEIKTSWSPQYILLTLVVSLLTGAGGYLLKYLLEPNDSADYFLLNRPYLEPRLEFAPLTNATPVFAIRNNGKLPAKDLSFALVSPQGSIGEGFCLVPKELSPGGEMVFSSPYTVLMYELAGNISLYAMYSSQIRGRTRYFRDRFDFAVAGDAERSSAVTYRLANREEASTSQDDLMDIMGIRSALDRDVGTYAFWYHLPTNVLDRPFLLFSSPSKALIYDQRAKTLTFEKYPQKRIPGVVEYWSVVLPQDMSGWHHYAIVWSNISVRLHVDGQSLGELPPQPTDNDFGSKDSPTTGSSVP